MQEFRAAHRKMFGSKINNNKIDNSKAIASTNLTTATSLSNTTISQINQTNLESSSNFEKFTCNNDMKLNNTNNMPSVASTTANAKISTISVTINKIIAPPPLPPLATATFQSTNQDNKLRKLNTFGKLIQTNDSQQRNLPLNVLPKNNLNGLNQNETVKILRTSSPNKKPTSTKGPAPKPPISNDSSKVAKIIKVNKKEERITFLNNNNGDRSNLFTKNYQQNQIKLEGQIETNSGLNNQPNTNRSLDTKYTSDLVEKSNYLASKSDISLSSLSIKVQVPTK